MLYFALESEYVVFASSYPASRGQLRTCAFCQKPVILITGEGKPPHFYHRIHSTCAPSVQTQWAYLQRQSLIGNHTFHAPVFEHVLPAETVPIDGYEQRVYVQPSCTIEFPVTLVEFSPFTWTEIESGDAFVSAFHQTLKGVHWLLVFNLGAIDYDFSKLPDEIYFTSNVLQIAWANEALERNAFTVSWVRNESNYSKIREQILAREQERLAIAKQQSNILKTLEGAGIIRRNNNH